MEGRRRLLLLALIIVAVAIGAVGLAFVSLFEADLAQQEALLRERVSDDGVVPASSVATLEREDEHWRVAPVSGSGVPVPGAVMAAVDATSLPPPGNTVAIADPQSRFLVLARVVDADRLQIAWRPLDEIRAPFRHAAWMSGIGLLILLMVGLALFWRTTVPMVRRIAASEARYRTLFGGTADAVLLIGDTVEECNPRATEMFRCAREEILGKPWATLFRQSGASQECLHRFRVHTDLALAGTSKPFMCRFQPEGGALLITEIMLRRLDEGGRFPRILASMRDVTDREQSADALREAERSVRESRERLVQAGRASALVELAAGIAHEVNQPLAAIANYAQASRRLVASGNASNADLDRTLDCIAAQAQRAGDAIHRIHALVTPGPDESRAIACINRLVRDVAALMDEDVRAAGAELALDLAEDIPPVKADPVRIQQVILQLLRNALESVASSPTGLRRVTVASRPVPDGVEVSVVDTGHGVGAEDAHRIFEPFFSTREDGMGMGLPISLSIIRAHAGELEFDPAYRQGACFRFRLAAAERSERSEAACRDKAAP